MSTHAHVGLVNDNGTVTAIFVHYDGYPAGLGNMLLQRYKDTASAAGLLALGGVVTVRETLDATKNAGLCEGIPTETFASIAAYLEEGMNAGSYTYLWMSPVLGWQCWRTVVTKDGEGYKRHVKPLTLPSRLDH